MNFDRPRDSRIKHRNYGQFAREGWVFNPFAVASMAMGLGLGERAAGEQSKSEMSR